MNSKKEYSTVILKSGKDQSLIKKHPWVFSGAIKKIKGEVIEGDIVKVINNKEEFLGLGHYQKSSIAVRVFSFEDIKIDYEFWKKKISQAIEYRRKLGYFNDLQKNNIFRLIHAEGDFIPGMIADYYNGLIVIQFYSVALYKMREEFAQILKELLGDFLIAVYDKSEKSLPFKADVNPENGFIIEGNGQDIVTENGLKYYIDREKGQKTGFFIDQRENRFLLGKYSQNKSVLNMFGYTGGFSVSALAGNASFVHTVDSSEKAVDLCNKNVNLNFPQTANHKGIVDDAFKFLENDEINYDIVVLDPPAFAKHQKVLNRALQGYKRINQKVLEKIPKGGLLFTFSCSQAVSKENFRKSVFVASVNAGRKVRILHQLSQPTDHPVNVFHPESEYLKGLVLFIE